MLYITSDLHLFHKRIIEFAPYSRPYSSIEDMHTDIIKKWNRVVFNTDTTYILGDVSFGKPQETCDILSRLNGNKNLIIGNHDTKLLRSDIFKSCFQSIKSYHDMKYNGEFLVMCHYPMASWNRSHYGSIMLHGHLHSRPSGVSGRIKDVGMDANNCGVYKIDDVIDEMLMIPHVNPETRNLT